MDHSVHNPEVFGHTAEILLRNYLFSVAITMCNVSDDADEEEH